MSFKTWFENLFYVNRIYKCEKVVGFYHNKRHNVTIKVIEIKMTDSAIRHYYVKEDFGTDFTESGMLSETLAFYLFDRKVNTYRGKSRF